MISATGSVIIPMRLKNYGRNHKKRKEYSSKRAFYRALSLLISGLNLPFMILGLFGYLTLFRRAERRSIRRLVILRRTTAVQV